MVDAKERVIWRSRKGGVVWWTTRILAFLPALAAAALFPLGLVFGRGLGAPALGALVASVALGAAGALVSPPIGRSFYLTDRRLVRINHFGAEDSLTLASIRGFARRLLGSGVQVAETNTVVLFLEADGRFVLHDVADAEGLERLLREGVLERRIDLSTLPEVEAVGASSGAEVERADLFLAEKTYTDGFAWGPVLIGPSSLLRIGGVPRPELASGLRALVASREPAVEVERRAAEIARQVGGTLEIDLSRSTLTLSGRTLVVRNAEREERLELRERDAERAARFLAARSVSVS